MSKKVKGRIACAKAQGQEQQDASEELKEVRRAGFSRIGEKCGVSDAGDVNTRQTRQASWAG